MQLRKVFNNKNFPIYSTDLYAKHLSVRLVVMQVWLALVVSQSEVNRFMIEVYT